MTETVFKEVRYDLGSLIKFIELGEIGLPDIQRPFVWKNTKVRDLFASMYGVFLSAICYFGRTPRPLTQERSALTRNRKLLVS